MVWEGDRVQVNQIVVWFDLMCLVFNVGESVVKYCVLFVFSVWLIVEVSDLFFVFFVELNGWLDLIVVEMCFYKSCCVQLVDIEVELWDVLVLVNKELIIIQWLEKSGVVSYVEVLCL